MLYYAEGRVYMVEGGKCRGCDVTAKDRVVEVREPESVTVVPKAEAELPEGAVPVTLDEVVRKLAVSEGNPCLFEGKRARKAKEG